MPQAAPGITSGFLVALVLGFALLVTGCATPQLEALRTAPGDDLPQNAYVQDVPFVPQTAYYCGPAALTMALRQTGLEMTLDEAAAEVYTPGLEGTLRQDVVAAARRQGRMAVQVNDLQALLTEIAAGHPVIVFQNLGLSIYPQWHFALAIGFDRRSEEVILHSGERRDLRTPFDTFERTWRRGDYWALVVTEPADLPASTGEAEGLEAALGLELAGRRDAARQAFQALTLAWPESYKAQMGLGNQYYALEDHPGAARAFQAASRLEPENPAPWNNLAYALHEMGQDDAALAAAKKAIAAAGENAAPYRDSLREITGELVGDYATSAQ
jgi:tetratricopeptide (TPR) repeat protein